MTEAGVQDAVTHIPHADEAELADLYSGAPAFVLPTTHEGPSATILEAMACGAPVITVDHTTIDEGFTEDALVLEAPEITRLAVAMLEVARNTDLARALSRGGREVASGFSWRRTARQTIDALAEVARGGRVHPGKRTVCDPGLPRPSSGGPRAGSRTSSQPDAPPGHGSSILSSVEW